MDSQISALEWRQCDVDIVQSGLSNFLQIFKHLTPKEQIDYIRVLIKEVIYDGAKGEIIIGFFVLPTEKCSVEAYGSMFAAGTKTLPDLDSNQEYRLQRAMCYRYTIRE